MRVWLRGRGWAGAIDGWGGPPDRACGAAAGLVWGCREALGAVRPGYRAQAAVNCAARRRL